MPRERGLATTLVPKLLQVQIRALLGYVRSCWMERQTVSVVNCHYGEGFLELCVAMCWCNDEGFLGPVRVCVLLHLSGGLEFAFDRTCCFVLPGVHSSLCKCSI